MKILLLVGCLVALLLLAVSAYVRLAPVTSPKISKSYAEDTTLAGGYVAVRPFTGDAQAVLARVEDIAMKTPRTTRLAGVPMTFVTRSRGFGFPDVTQVRAEGGRLTIYAHLVYGKADLGVNKARVLAWLDALGPL